MNRRGFFQSLALAGAVLAAPNLFLPRHPVRWKRQRQVWVPNPEYVRAQFEILFVDQPPLFDAAILEGDPIRPRFKLDAQGRFEPVPPYIPA